jgi:hypothetical protein
MSSSPWPFPPGTATGIGSLPGSDVQLAQQRIFDLLPEFPHLVELPERGPGADMIGRSAALLVDLFVDLQPSGWRLVDRPGREVRRAADLLDRDLDTLAEVADGWSGPLKLQATGPWTLAAALELTRGDKAVSDFGAVRDLTDSLADGLAAYVARVAGLVPGAELIVQLDEPSLPATLAGHLPTASGFSVLRTPDPTEVLERLAVVFGQVPLPGVHCCARSVPVGLLRDAGARWVSLDLAMLDPIRDDDALGEALEGGTGLVLGTEPDGVLAAGLAKRLGMTAQTWLDGVVLSPPCGLTGQSEGQAWSTVKGIRGAARRLAEEIGEAG